MKSKVTSFFAAIHPAMMRGDFFNYLLSTAGVQAESMVLEVSCTTTPATTTATISPMVFHVFHRSGNKRERSSLERGDQNKIDAKQRQPERERERTEREILREREREQREILRERKRKKKGK